MMCKMQIAVARVTQLSTERANDRLITVHAPFLAIAPNQNATLQFVLCTIDPQCQDDCCRLCGFVFWRRNENEILFGNFGVELLEGHKHAVWHL